eukprot:864472-Rhodomonas_salina.1
MRAGAQGVGGQRPVLAPRQGVRQGHAPLSSCRTSPCPRHAPLSACRTSPCLPTYFLWHIAYLPTRFLWQAPLSSVVFSYVTSPFPLSRPPVVLRISYAMFGTGIWPRPPIILRMFCAISGTDMWYAPTRLRGYLRP